MKSATIDGVKYIAHPIVEVLHRGDEMGERIGKTQRIDITPVTGESYSENVQFWYDHTGQLVRITSRRADLNAAVDSLKG